MSILNGHPREGLGQVAVGNVQIEFHHAADLMKLDRDIRNMLRIALDEIEVSFPVVMDGGRFEIFIGAPEFCPSRTSGADSD